MHFPGWRIKKAGPISVIRKEGHGKKRKKKKRKKKGKKGNLKRVGRKEVPGVFLREAHREVEPPFFF